MELLDSEFVFAGRVDRADPDETEYAKSPQTESLA